MTDRNIPDRNVPLGALRTFVTLLVVAHHAVLAYHPYAPPPAPSMSAAPMLWMAFPIVDAMRAKGVDLFVAFNDLFFMSLMFFLSGLFAWPSLARKGATGFTRDRALRLGLPFVVSAAVLAPLAYYATYLAQTGASVPPFFKQWTTLGVWPAGPAWFLWVLLAFGLVAALAFRLAPGWGAAIGRFTGRLSPIGFFGVLIVVSALVYLPMAGALDPMRWVSFGPFFVQISRLLHYAVYFFLGAGLGAYGLERGLLAQDGKLARRWPLWIVGSLVGFALAIIMFVIIISTIPKGGPGAVLGSVGNFTFVLSCAASSLACLAVFLRFVKSDSRVMQSLSANAYGIFLLHYFCVSWLQLALLRTQLPGAAKGLLVFVGAVAVSWSLSAMLRRIPAVRRVV
jgi:peptidoglycan/LPS O-acetylase OafA/YrhL